MYHPTIDDSLISSLPFSPSSAPISPESFNGLLADFQMFSVLSGRSAQIIQHVDHTVSPLMYLWWSQQIQCSENHLQLRCQAYPEMPRYLPQLIQEDSINLRIRPLKIGKHQDIVFC